jgi:hypothetical protein
MCDEQMHFLRGPRPFAISNIDWDEGCDYVEFESEFPAQPFSTGPITIGHNVVVRGYLCMRSGGMPQCGGHTEWLGKIVGVQPCEGRRQWRMAKELKREKRW